MADFAVSYLIIGNSAGGIGAAEAIRHVDAEGTIAIISDEKIVAYSRPAIAEIVAGSKTVETIIYRDEDFYRSLGIQTLFGVAATNIDTEAHTVSLADGSTIVYGKLLIATGGTPIRPPMEGSDKTGVFNFTTIADALAVRERLDSVGKRVVVIGAGLIGAACSDALIRMGGKPTVIELRDRPLNLLLDEPGSELARRAMEKAGVDLICNATVKQVLGRPEDEGSVGAAILADGRRIECDAVVVAVGVRPRMSLATEAGIKTNRGIVVNQRMETSALDVYACGDVAETFDCIINSNRVVPIWPGAFRGGRIAGHNMAGCPDLSEDMTVMNSLKYFGMTLVSAGEIAAAGAEGYETLRRLDVARDDKHGDTYKKIVLKDNRIVGFVFAGDIEHSGIVNWLLTKKIDIGACKGKLLKDGFDLIDLPADVRRAHYGEASASPAHRQIAWGRPLSNAADPRTNGGTNGGH